MLRLSPIHSFFFFNDTATSEIYTLSLHDALPISRADLISDKYLKDIRAKLDADAFNDAAAALAEHPPLAPSFEEQRQKLISELDRRHLEDRKSTRLNSSHVRISYAVFCLKKKKQK